MQYFVNTLYCMYRQQSGVVTLIVRSASVTAYFLFCGKRFAIRVYPLDCLNCCFQTSPGLMEHSESLEIEVLSHLVSHSCVAGVGLCGEIGFDVIAFIVWETLLCRVYFSHSTRLSAHLLICISFADEIMFCFFFCLLPIKPSSVFSVTQVVYFWAVFVSAQMLLTWELMVVILSFSEVWSVLQTVSH